MAGSRLDRIGTIFSRSTGLLKSGAISYNDRPLWYDVYRVFPPKYEPHIDREAEKTEVLDIMYQEDKFRAKFFKKFGRNPGGVARNLSDRSFEEPSQPFVNICLNLKKENPDWNAEQVFDSAAQDYRPSAPPQETSFEVDSETTVSKRHGRKPATMSAQSLLSLFNEAKEKQDKEDK